MHIKSAIKVRSAAGLILVAFFYFGANSAFAGGCSIYRLGEGAPPRNILSAMRASRDKVARICWSKNGKLESYYSVSAVTSDYGVCRFKETEKPNDGRGSTIYMAVSKGGKCLKQGDVSYVNVDGVSAGVFHKLDEFWARAMSSPDNFEDAMSSPLVKSRNPEAYRFFKRAIAQNSHPFKLQRASYTSMGQVFPGYGYELAGDFSSHGEPTLYVDMTENGFKIFGMALVIE